MVGGPVPVLGRTRRGRDHERRRADGHRARGVGELVVRVRRSGARRGVAAHGARRRGRGRTRRLRGERAGGVPVHEARVRRRDGRDRASVGHRCRRRRHLQRSDVDGDCAVLVRDGVVRVRRSGARRGVATHGARRHGCGRTRRLRGERAGGVPVHEARVRRRDGGGPAPVGARSRRGGDHERGLVDGQVEDRGRAGRVQRVAGVGGGERVRTGRERRRARAPGRCSRPGSGSRTRTR